MQTMMPMMTQAQMRVELRELSANDGPDILAMLREIGPGENGFDNEGFDVDEIGFRDYLHKKINESRGIDLVSDRVPQTMYWLMVEGYPAGLGKVRYYLNDRLRAIGGHIGYCIRPSARGHGYGNIILSELLLKAKEKGIPKALLTCREANTRSRRVIEYNGGRLDRIGNEECLYWIGLREPDGIYEIHIDDYDEVYGFWRGISGLGTGDADSRQNMEQFLLRNRGMSFCCTEGGRIVGTVLCSHDKRRGYIYHAAVAKECRGRGIGRVLIEKSLLRLKEEGINKCHLFCFKDNKPGNTFWRSSGWTRRKDIYIYSKLL